MINEEPTPTSKNYDSSNLNLEKDQDKTNKKYDNKKQESQYFEKNPDNKKVSTDLGSRKEASQSKETYENAANKFENSPDNTKI